MNNTKENPFAVTGETSINMNQSLNSDLLIHIGNEDPSTNYIDQVESLYINVKEKDMQKFINNLQTAFEKSKQEV